MQPIASPFTTPVTYSLVQRNLDFPRSLERGAQSALGLLYGNKSSGKETGFCIKLRANEFTRHSEAEKGRSPSVGHRPRACAVGRARAGCCGESGEVSACVVAAAETGIRIQSQKDLPGVLRSPGMRFLN